MVISISFTFNAAENREIASNLEHTIIVEKTEVINLAQTASEVYACSNFVKCMYSLSPTKVLIVFECQNDAANVVNVDSDMWNVFDDVRFWSEGEMFDDRLV